MRHFVQRPVFFPRQLRQIPIDAMRRACCARPYPLGAATMSSTTIPEPAANRRPEYEEPIYWFTLLDRAIDRGDLDAVADAKRELDRLGITVCYRRLHRKAVRRG